MTHFDHRSKAELDLMTALERSQQVSQSGLARRLGIAAGLVNILMKRAVRKGFVKMRQIPARRYAYYLTPRGFAEKSRLVAQYLDASLSLFRRLRVEYRDLFQGLEARGIDEVVLVGDIDIAEVAIMASFDTSVRITMLVNGETNRARIGPVQVINRLPTDCAHIAVICDARKPQACFENLAATLAPHQIAMPPSFLITPPPSSSPPSSSPRPHKTDEAA